MQIIAITGGFAAGKSTAAAFFRECGATVIDLDAEVRRLLDADSDIRHQVAQSFPGCIGSDGLVDRAVLAHAAFASRESLAVLSRIIHPVVARDVGEYLRDIRLRSKQPDVVIIEVPLLAEAPTYAGLADLVVALEAPFEVRLARAMARGFDEDDVRRRVALQAPDSARAELADVVINTDVDKSEFLKRLSELWNEYVAVPCNGGTSE